MRHLVILIFGGILLMSSNTTAQIYYGGLMEREVKEFIPRTQPLRFGIKVGFPNLVGGNVEYVTGIMRNRIAFNVDYSTIQGEWLQDVMAQEDPLDLEFRYLEGGMNIYFLSSGKGLYLNASYGLLDFEETRQDVESEQDSSKLGTGTTDFMHHSFNLKLGAKLGGFIYFRPEVGYTFTPVPEGIPMEVAFEDGSTEMQSTLLNEDGAPYGPLFQGLIFNIGLGIAF